MKPGSLLRLITCLGCLSPAYAATLHVAVTGRDEADGKTPLTAFRTLQRAADLVEPGDTVEVGPGVYFETVRLTRAGTVDRPITFRADRVSKNRMVLSGANRVLREGVAWELVDAALGLYAVRHSSLTGKPSRVLYSGT